MAETGREREGEIRAPPTWNSGKLSYDAWRFEVELWDDWTTMAGNRRGRLVMVALPVDDPSGAREKVRLAIQNKDMDINADNGVEQVLTELDKSFKKDDLSNVWEVWSNFIDCRKRDKAMSVYITEYEQKVNQLKKEKIVLPDVVMAMQLLNGCELEKNDRQIVLTAVDYGKKDQLLSQMKSALKKFHVDAPQLSKVNDNILFKVKEEPVNFTCTCANNEEAFFTRSNYRGGRSGFLGSRGGGRYSGGPRFTIGHGRSFNRGGNRGGMGSSGPGENVARRRMNPKDFYGNIMKCNVCESIRHLQRDCPDAWENMSKNVMEVKDEQVMKVKDFSVEDQQVLMCEAMNAAVLDSACTKTVTGKIWKDTYLESLSPEERNQVKYLPGGTKFRFGGETQKESFEKLQIPVTIAGNKTIIITDVVDSDIPLLLSKPDMKRFGMKLDLEKDTVSIFGKIVELETTSSGHYCLPLKECEVSLENVHHIIEEKSQNEKAKIVLKLHRQFAHPSAKNLKALMKNADALNDDTECLIDEISQSCIACKRYKKTPARPVVCLPLANSFNETVALDLKMFKSGVYILHIIDIFTRFSLAKVIKRKLPSVIVENVIEMWISSGLGAPDKFLVDNGGEFCNELFREMAEQFNVQMCTTGAESPWSNGICERNHAVTDAAVCRMIEEDPNMNIETALVWAVNAKNAMLNHNGFSPYQLVYGQNPKLPSVMTNKLPALEDGVTSEKIAKHLNALHAARRAFVKAEASERIKRALRHQVRSVEERFNSGDQIFYKRDDSNRWRGPGRVIGQDGKVVFVRHGDQLVRVSTCRMVKIGQEFSKPSSESSGSRVQCEVLPSSSQVSSTGVTVSSTVSEGDHYIDDNYDDNAELIPVASADVIPMENVANRGKTQDERLIEDQDEHQRNQSLSIGEREQVDGQISGGQSRERNISTVSKLKDLPEKGDVIKYRQSDDMWLEATVLGRGGKATGRNKYWFNVQNSEDEKKLEIDLATVDYEIIRAEDAHWNEDVGDEEVHLVFIPTECHGNREVVEAKESELQNWKSFDVYTEEEEREQKTLSTRWVITEKVMPDGRTGAKARLVVRGFEEECRVQADSPTAAKATLRAFFAVTANERWKCETIDIKAAFLQGKEIDRDVFVRPPPEVGAEGYVWKLKKVAYGLGDAARNWFFSVVNELKDLKCKQSLLDKALFRWYSNGRLHGMFLMHVDDFLVSGTELFMTKVVKPFCKKYKVSKRQDGSFRYLGLDVVHTEGEMFIQQDRYISEMKTIELSTKRKRDKEAFLDSEETRELRVVGQLNWVSSQTRPDVTFDMMVLSMATKQPQVHHAIEANKAVHKVKKRQSGVLYQHLGNIEDLSLEVYTDASWANLPDGSSSAGGYVILLKGKDGRSAPLDWSANKIKRVVHSTLAAEALAMLDGVDNAIYLGSLLSEIYKDCYRCNMIPVMVYTDNKSVHENLKSTKQVHEKRLRVTMAELRESLSSGEVKKVDWVPSKLLLADLLTKRGVCSDDLLDCFASGKLIS